MVVFKIFAKANMVIHTKVKVFQIILVKGNRVIIVEKIFFRMKFRGLNKNSKDRRHTCYKTVQLSINLHPII